MVRCACCRREIATNLAALYLHPCELCGRSCCDRCLKSIATDRPDGLLAGTYCRTCLGERRKR